MRWLHAGGAGPSADRVVSAYSEIVPGHAHLDKIADAVKAGVRMAGGTPILIPAIGVCDGIAMADVA